MTSLQPVDFDPFATAQSPAPAASPMELESTGPKLVPVEGDPFVAAPFRLTPIEGNPFGTAPQEPASFGQAFGRGVDQLQGMLYGAVEAAGEATGATSLKEFGTEGRVRNVAEAKQYPPKQEFLKAEGVGDYAQWAKETLAELIPSAGTSLVGGVAGGLVGGVPSALVGAAVPSMILGTGEIQGAIKEKAPEAQAPGWAFGGGAVIGALDAVVPGKIGSKLVGRFGAEVASDIATRTLNKAAQRGFTRETLSVMGTEGLTEALQEAVEEVAASGAVDKAPDWKGLPSRMVEAGAAGVLGGAVFGGGASVLTAGGEARPGVSGAPATKEAIQQTFEAVTPEAETAGAAQPSAKAPAPTFYSQVRKVAEEKLPNVVDPQQALATLRNAEGVKSEELQELGIEAWLARQVGKVSKKDIIAEIETNAIVVQDVVHTESPQIRLSWGPATPETSGLTRELSTRENMLVTPEAPGWRIVRVRGLDFGSDSFDLLNPRGAIAGTHRTLEAAQGQAARELRGPSNTQYRDYTLPGGENYREHLLILPTKKKTVVDIARGFGTKEVSKPESTYRSPHFEEPNIVAHFRSTDRVDAEGKRVLFVEEIQSDWHQAGRKFGYKPLDAPLAVSYAVSLAPFRTSWVDLAFKRILRLAADEGYDRVAWTPGSVQAERYGLGSSAAKGQSEFYDKMVPAIAEKWARKLGTKTGITVLPDTLGGIREGKYPVNAKFIEVTLEAATRVQRGLSLFSQKLGKGTTLESELQPGTGVVNGIDLEVAAARAALTLNDLTRSMGIETPIVVKLVSSLRGSLGWFRPWTLGNKVARYEISLAVGAHATPEALFASAAHEFGHLIVHDKFSRAPIETQLAIQIAYEKYYNEVTGNRTFADMIARRDNFISITQDLRAVRGRDRPILSLSPEQRQYWLGFDEWMAEQVARWATTSEKPLSVVDKFFVELSKRLRQLYEVFVSRFGLLGEPNKFVKDWLDSLVYQPESISFNVVSLAEERSQLEAQRAMRSGGAPDFPVEARTGATTMPRDLLDRLNLAGGTEAKAMSAGADRFNKFYNMMVSMVQLADRNLHIAPLQRYRELWQLKQLERANIMNESLETLKAWRRLGRGPSDKLAELIDDYMNLRYLTETERAGGVSRRPTEAEFAKLVRDNGVGDSGLGVFRRVVADFDRILVRYEEILRQDARRISDPALQAAKLASIAEQIARFKQQPYFPSMRFGDFTLTVRDTGGKVIHFETFEKQRTRGAAMKEIQGRLKAGETLQVGVLAKDAAPMIGLPPGLLDAMAEKLALSPAQRQSLEQIRFEMAPAQSFKHRFQRKNRVEGYSQDFMRAYANYFFHGSNYFTKVKYIDALREQVGAVRDSAKTLTDSTKRGQIANFLSDHLAYMMDPKPDFAALRSIMFTWALGFSPAAAALNLSQMLMGSYPFLASKFGDISAVAAMTKAGARVSTYYKKATLAGIPERDMRAVSEAVKEGIISEAQAAELAAISEGNNLGKGFGGTHSERIIHSFLEKGAWMFEMTEQMNRRITFRAAWSLASAKPGAKYVQEMVAKHALQYQRLRDKGWTEADAAAFVAAKDAVEATQFVYQQYAQPRFMRGHFRTVFIFKSFLQNTLFMLWNYPTAAVRSLLIMGFLGGMMGVPGAEDLRGILKAIAWKIFGADYDLEDEARKLVIDVTSGKVRPDLVLHGISRIGFGIPAAMSMVGVPLPQIDMSKSIGLGQISPVDFGQLGGPAGTANSEKVIAQQTQRASGAAFGVPFAIYKALTDGQLAWNDFKRWQSAMPRELGALTKSYRAFSEGQERNRAGNAVVRFDVSDPQQMMEVLGMAAGFNSTRLSAQWDLIVAQREAIQYWDLRKQGLMRQAWAARKSGDKESWGQVLGAIRKFNTDLPKEARLKAITADMLRGSFTARARAGNAQESGVPTHRSDIPIVQEIQRLYPEAQVDVRRVR